MNCLRDVHLEWAGIDYLLRAFLEKRNFFSLDFNISNEPKNVGYNIFKVNCFLKHPKGAFVYRNFLPARLR